MNQPPEPDPAQREALVAHLLEFVSAGRRQRMADVLPLRTSRVQVVLEDIFQPHNASAVMRSCECFGIQHLHVIENRYAYTLNSEVAMGASNWIHLHRYREPEENNSLHCLNTLRQRGFQIVATCLDPDAVPLEDISLDRPLALWFGTEEDGLSSEVLDAADQRIRIPMYGFTQSFNLSVCAAICLHGIRTRMQHSGIPWQLSESEKTEVMLHWLRHSVKRAAIIEKQFLAKLAPDGEASS